MMWFAESTSIRYGPSENVWLLYGLQVTPSPSGDVMYGWGPTELAPVFDPYFKGQLDDFRIYDRALTAEQVSAIAHP